MRRTILALVVAGLVGGSVFGLSGCYASSASVGVGVEAGVPAPVGYYDYYRDGYVFIDGHWAWTAYGWRWYPGYWVVDRPGYLYVQGYWDYWGGSWLWRPGIWARSRNGYVWVGNRWHRYQPGYHHFDYRRGTWVRRGGSPSRDYRGVRPSARRDDRARSAPSPRRDGRSTYRRRR